MHIGNFQIMTKQINPRIYVFTINKKRINVITIYDKTDQSTNMRSQLIINE